MNPRLLLVILCAFCSACAARKADVSTAAQAANSNDPLESYNRNVMKLNSGLTKFVIRPVVTVYRAIMPKPLRSGIANISANAKTPLIFVHDVLQGEPDRAFKAMGRFLMNSTVGLGGALDVATKAGVPAHDEDAGQTFARWGVKSGPYIMLPLLGPSNLRDTLGSVADIFADPMRYVLRSPTVPLGIGPAPVSTGVAIANRKIGVRSDIGTGLLLASLLTQMDQNIDRLGELERGSLDPYVALRESYRQYRQAAIDNERPRAPRPEDDPLASELDAPQ